MPYLGEEVRVVLRGREVHFVFVANDQHQAEEFAESLAEQCERGIVYISIADTPINVGYSGKGN